MATEHFEQQVTAARAEQGVAVVSGRRNRVVVARQHTLHIRLPAARLGEHGVLVLRGGDGPLVFSRDDARPLPSGRLLFSLPIQKSRRYTLLLRESGNDHPIFVAGNLTAAIDHGRTRPEKQAPCGPDVGFLGAPRKPGQRGRTRVEPGAARPTRQADEGSES